MPLSPQLVGQITPAQTHNVDARWIMAYAAALNDFNPRMFDTHTHSPVIAHPVFPVCVEWPLVLASGRLKGYELLLPEEAGRGVHAAHDLHLQRPIRAGDQLTTTAEIIGVDARKAGALVCTHLVTKDASNVVVAESFQLGINRGVALQGDPQWSRQPPAPPVFKSGEGEPRVISVPIGQGMAHTYTECARIWNPIHSDRAVALAAGLPDIILHGTATLALAVSAVVNNCFEGRVERVRRLGGRFSAMVLVPSTIRVEIEPPTSGGARFRVHNAEGQVAVQEGFVVVE